MHKSTGEIRDIDCRLANRPTI